MRLLVIFAHPDDAEFSCAGTIAKLAKNNDVFYLACTSGECGIEKKMSIAKKRTLREAEQKIAAKILGVKNVFFLRERDCYVENTLRLRKKIVAIIRKVRPSIVFAFDPANTSFDNFYLFHADHRNTAIAAFDAFYPSAGNKNFMPGTKPHKPRELHFFGTEKPNKWVDITKTISKKIEALDAHESQKNKIYNDRRIKYTMNLCITSVKEGSAVRARSAMRTSKKKSTRSS